MSSIKNVIFDFGNVLINLDFDLTKIEYAKLFGIEEAIKTKEKLIESGLLFDYETGRISEKDFFNGFKAAADRPDISNEAMKDAWEALLLDIPFERIEMLKKLKKMGYGVYMLSNINDTHATSIHNYLEKTYQISEEAWRAHFDIMYYSHEMGHRKPDAGIYKFMLEDSGLVADECLFIDDLAENTAAANQFGIHTITHDPKGDILAVVSEKLGITL